MDIENGDGGDGEMIYTRADLGPFFLFISATFCYFL
jgi:hypothetical protein